jgi:aspartyl-tRNA(Asn)/glutamyl-tRNA(Gln) amidotransferase subunit A
MSEALDTVDALVSPTMANPPPTIEEATRRFSSEDEVRERVFGARANTTPYNLAGFPAMSIPCGFTKSGLPIGLQVGGRPFEEAMLFRVAAA